MPGPAAKTPEAKARQLAGLRAPFKAGDGWAGNKLTRRLGASIKDWWNALSKENEDGHPKYTMAQIGAFANAPLEDTKVSPAKRIAARHIIEMAQGGRTGREITALVFERTDGKAPQHFSVSGGPEVKRVILMDQAEVIQRALPESNGA